MPLFLTLILVCLLFPCPLRPSRSSFFCYLTTHPPPPLFFFTRLLSCFFSPSAHPPPPPPLSPSRFDDRLPPSPISPASSYCLLPPSLLFFLLPSHPPILLPHISLTVFPDWSVHRYAVQKPFPTLQGHLHGGRGTPKDTHLLVVSPCYLSLCYLGPSLVDLLRRLYILYCLTKVEDADKTGWFIHSLFTDTTSASPSTAVRSGVFRLPVF